MWIIHNKIEEYIGEKDEIETYNEKKANIVYAFVHVASSILSILAFEIV